MRAQSSRPSRSAVARFLEGSPIVFGRVQVAERAEVGIDAAELIGLDDAGPHRLHQEDRPQPVGPEQAVDDGEDRRAAVEGGQGVMIAVDERDREVVIADPFAEPGDPGGLEEWDVGGGRIGQLDRVGQGGEPGG